MSGEFDAIGTMAEGGLWARAAEPNAGEHSAGGHGTCLNCGTVLTGPHCHQCGQAAHVHRSIAAFWHDILHGVLHFDGKFWNTLPLLVWKPGDLTRRYVHGERAKFISPMALFLFSIFLMFAIFSYVGSPDFTDKDAKSASTSDGVVAGANGWREAMLEQLAKLESQVAEKEKALAAMPASDPNRASLASEISDLKGEANGLSYATRGKRRYTDLENDKSAEEINPFIMSDGVNTGSKAFDAFVNKLAAKASKNPELLLYKLQSNGYKFAWLLIPLSIPFVWLATLGKRGHRFYDHAVFTTYSIAFMSLLFIVVTLSVKFSILPGLIIPAAIFFAPFHMYRQLRHAYGTSRIGGIFRLAVLLSCTSIVVMLFLSILISLGLVG